MKFHTLAGLITTTLLFAGCDSGGGPSDDTAISTEASTELAPAGALGDELTFPYLLVTGYSSVDTNAYWNCSIQGPGHSLENLHMRFWEDSTGFSGSDATTWQQVGDNGVDILFDGGSFVFRDVYFSSSEQENDVLSASNANGDNVICQRLGPLRGQSGDLLLDDQTLGLLESHLLNQTDTSWTCQEQDSEANVYSVNYEFLAYTVASVDGKLGRWYVDESYNVVLSIGNEVRVIRDVQFTDQEAGRNHFRASLYDRSLDCNLT